MDGGLTNYGDPEFASFLRRSMARSMGVSRELLDKPVVGIAVTPSDFNNNTTGGSASFLTASLTSLRRTSGLP